MASTHTQHPFLKDSTEVQICDECRNDAHRFIEGVHDAWTREEFCDTAFLYVVVWLAGEALTAVQNQPGEFEPDKRRYYGRKLQSIGAAIAGDVQ